jgi:hypothetical protein
LATVSFDEPRMLPVEILTKTDWPAARPDMLLTVGYDNPVPPPFIPIPKNPGQTSSVMPDLFEAPSTSALSNQAPGQNISSRAPENLIRPRPLTMESPNSVARFQGNEPPLAGQANIPAPLAQPQILPQTPPGVVPVPAPAPIQPVPANLAAYAGCGCEARIGVGCGCGARAASGCGCHSFRQAPLCCQTFATCCQPSVSCCEVIESPCCSGGNSHWRPFAKLRSWSHRSLFSKFRGLFHKNRAECCYSEPGEYGECAWASGSSGYVR